MQHTSFARCCLWAGAFFAAHAIAADNTVFTRTPAQIQWNESATAPQGQPLHADPAYGVVTKRVRIPPNTDLPPHGHPSGYRLVTVISGTLLMKKPCRNFPRAAHFPSLRAACILPAHAASR